MSETIGHYEILGLLGTSGSGTVYRARDTQVGRTVAIRVLGDPSGDPARRATFLETARRFAEVSHPHIATLFEAGEHAGALYLVYEFVPGERLVSLAGGRPLNLRRALDLCTQVADALAEAHAFGLAHGALSLASIAVTPKGHAKILDFGLAACTAPASSAGQPADPQADLVALGAILFELLTGRQPFADGGAVRDTDAPPPRAPSRLQADIPREVDTIVLKAIGRDAGRRYESAAALAADLRGASSLILQRATADEMASPASAAASPASPWRTALLAALLLAALAVAAWNWREPLQRAWRGRFGPVVSPVVAVMPFIVGSDDVDRVYVGAGTAEEIARLLGHIPGVTVKGRSTIRDLGGKPAVTVAAETGASVVLTGTIGRGPGGWGSVDLRVELVSGTDGRSIWTGRYTGPARDIGAIESRVARDVATRLRVPMPDSPGRDRGALRLVDPDAYDAYLQGRDARAAGDTAKATTLFENAIEADPSLIPAQAALVETLYLAAAFDARVSFTTVFDRMRRTAEEAETVDPDLAPVQLARGLAANDLREALQHLRRAIELDRSYSDAYLAMADVLRDVDPARAIGFARRAADLDPAQPFAIYQQAAASLALAQYPDTLAALARGQALLPTAPWWDALRLRVSLVRAGAQRAAGSWPDRSASDFAPAAVTRALVLAAEGRRAEAIAALTIVMRMNPDFCQGRALLAGLLFQDGNRAEALRMAGAIEQAALGAGDQAPWARCAATAAAGIGDAARTASWIRRAALDDRALRLWTAANVVLSPTIGLRQRTYPWSNVLDTAAVGYAVASLESALARARADGARVLDGLDRRP